MASAVKPFGLRRLFVWLLLIAAVVGFIVAAFFIDFDPYFRALPFTDNPDAPWFYGPFGFAFMCVVAISVSCPRQVVSFFAGYFFGVYWGVAAALLAATLSCAFVYGLACLFRERARPYVKGRVKIAVGFWKENTFWATLIWRFIPAGSNLLTNVAAGVLSIPHIRFVTGSAIGYIPHTVVFAILGSGVQIGSGVQTVFSGLLFVVVVVVGVVLYRKHKIKITNAEDQT